MNKQEFDNLKEGTKVWIKPFNNPDRDLYWNKDVWQYIGHIGETVDFSDYKDRVSVKFNDGNSWYYLFEDLEIVQDNQSIKKETDMQKTKTPHKHAAIIKAWADGEEIEVKTVNGKWRDLTSTPSWTGIDYRIKPKFEKRYQWAYLSRSGDGWTVSNEFYSEARWKEFWSHLESQKIEASGKDFQIN